MKKAELYQAISESPLNWSVILGIAVATIVRWSETRKMASASAVIMAARRPPVGYPSISASSEAGFVWRIDCLSDYAGWE